MDNRRQWYRYHHLFADLLINRLQSSEPELIPLLHRKASQWCEQEGLLADAVDYAILARDFDRALGLIEQTAQTSDWASGELPVLLNWAKRLPEDILMTRPRLCLYSARALFFAGKIEAAQKYMQAALKTLKTLHSSSPATGELWGVFYINQATFAAMRGESRTALEFGQQALPLLPEAYLSSQAMIFQAIGWVELFTGRMQPAEQAFTKSIPLAREAGNRSLALDASAILGETLRIAVQPLRALPIFEEALSANKTSHQSFATSTIYI
jgi:LuxR family maltose regulon positive regulatory protein